MELMPVVEVDGKKVGKGEPVHYKEASRRLSQAGGEGIGIVETGYLEKY